MKNLKPAFIQWFGAQNGQERTAYLKGGAKGNGKVLATAKYWPESGVSMDRTGEYFMAAADRQGYEIVASDRDIEE